MLQKIRSNEAPSTRAASAKSNGMVRKYCRSKNVPNAPPIKAGSHNGTYLNGQRLIAHQPRVLRDGDDIRLGFLVLRVKFVRVPITS